MTVMDSLCLPLSLNLTMSVMRLRLKVMDYLDHQRFFLYGEESTVPVVSVHLFMQIIHLIMQICYTQVEKALLKCFRNLDKHSVTLDGIEHSLKKSWIRSHDTLSSLVTMKLYNFQTSSKQTENLVTCSRSTPNFLL